MSQCLVVNYNKIKMRCDFIKTWKVVLKYDQYTLMSIILDCNIAKIEQMKTQTCTLSFPHLDLQKKTPQDFGE